MRYILLVSVFLLVCTSAQAYNPVRAEPTEAYSVIPITDDPYLERSYLGDLNDAPDLYELKTEVAITLRVEVRQRAGRKAVPFGLILVRQNDADGAVVEIARQSEPLGNWTIERDYWLGMKFLTAPVMEREITPGTYRIEISTPDNQGSYSLTIGEESTFAGLFTTLIQIVKTQYHFGFTPFHLIFSLYFLAIITILSSGVWIFWRRQRHSKKY